MNKRSNKVSRGEPATPVASSPAAGKGDRTRATIVASAYAWFTQRGYHGTSMRQIAKRAGIAPGGIYNHFDDKESIFAAVLEANHPYRSILKAIQDAEGETVDDFILDAANAIRSIIADVDKRLLPLLFIEMVEFQGRHLAPMAEAMLPSLLDIARDFSERPGNLRPIPLPIVLRSFIGLFPSFVFTDMVLRNMPLMRDLDYDWFGGMIDIYLHGIVEAPGAGLPGAPAEA